MSVGCAGIFLFVYLAAVVPWQLRNWIHTGYSGFSPVGVWNLYCVYRPQVEHFAGVERSHERPSHPGVPDLCSIMGDPGANFEKLEGFLEKHNFMQRESMRVIINNPGRTAMTVLSGLSKFFLSPGMSDFPYLVGIKCPEEVKQAAKEKGLWHRRMIYLQQWPVFFLLDLLLALWLWFLVFMAIRAVFRFRLCRKIDAVLLVVTIGYYAILSTVVLGGARLRLPVMPLICVLAGMEIGRYLSNTRRAKPITLAGSTSEPH